MGNRWNWADDDEELDNSVHRVVPAKPPKELIPTAGKKQVLVKVSQELYDAMKRYEIETSGVVRKALLEAVIRKAGVRAVTESAIADAKKLKPKKKRGAR